MQWGYKTNAKAGGVDNSNNTNTFTFPVALKTVYACFAIFHVSAGNNNRDVTTNLLAISTQSVSIRCWDGQNAGTDGNLYYGVIGV